MSILRVPKCLLLLGPLEVWIGDFMFHSKDPLTSSSKSQSEIDPNIKDLLSVTIL